MNSQHAPSYYAASANPQPERHSLKGRVDADVCIVGAGYTGLSAGLDVGRLGESVAATAWLSLLGAVACTLGAVPVGILALIANAFLVEDPPSEKAKKKTRGIDYVGLSLITIGIGCLDADASVGHLERHDAARLAQHRMPGRPSVRDFRHMQAHAAQ